MKKLLLLSLIITGCQKEPETPVLNPDGYVMIHMKFYPKDSCEFKYMRVFDWAKNRCWVDDDPKVWGNYDKTPDPYSVYFRFKCEVWGTGNRLNSYMDVWYGYAGSQSTTYRLFPHMVDGVAKIDTVIRTK